MPSQVETVRAAVAGSLARAAPPPDALIVVALSGGPDSVCLLDALSAAGPRLAVVHVDHGLRGPAAQHDARLAERQARAAGVECTVRQADVGAYARAARLGLEEAARNARYQLLLAEAARRNAWSVATGHTRDDHVELLLINMIRGTGPTGFATFPPTIHHTQGDFAPPLPELDPPAAGSVRIDRPLLEVGRAQTVAYCRERGLDYAEDASNADPAFTRNRIRHHLLPLLRTYNPSIVDTLARLARLVGEDETELERLTDEVWRRCAGRSGASVRFAWSDWAALSVALRRRLLRRASRELLGREAWSFRSIEAARTLLDGRSSGRRLALGGGVRLATARQGFRLTVTSARSESSPPVEP